MGVRGIGGIFFKADDPERIAAWYEEHLGIGRDTEGFATMGWRELDRPDAVGETVWAPFPRDTEYFGADDGQWMINYRVDDLEAELARLKASGVELVGEPETFEYGTFAWGRDIEGNKFELWEPADETGFQITVPEDGMGATNHLFLVCEPAHTMAAADGMSDDEIVVEASIDRSPEELWPLWTSEEGLREWLVPNSNIELKIGGRYEWLFVPENDPGKQGGEGNKILSFLPHRMLSFTWNAPPTLPYTRHRHTHVVVEFTADGDGGTLVRLTHLGWPSEEADDHEEWAKTLDYFRTAWVNVLGALERHCE